MPRTGTFRYHFDAGRDLAVAVERLSDMATHAAAHPLIVAVRTVPPPLGAIRRYHVTDRIALGPVRFRITYTADLVTVTGDRVIFLAHQWPAVTVRNDIALSRAGDRVRADVEIAMTAPTAMFGSAFRQARRAHLTLADHLARALGD
jgi:hypothetical protein